MLTLSKLQPYLSKQLLKTQKNVKRNRNHVLKCNLYQYFFYTTKVAEVAKFHHCRICATEHPRKYPSWIGLGIQFFTFLHILVMCSSNINLSSVMTINSFLYVLLFTIAAPIFTFSILSVLRKKRHLSSFPLFCYQ